MRYCVYNNFISIIGLDLNWFNDRKISFFDKKPLYDLYTKVFL